MFAFIFKVGSPLSRYRPLISRASRLEFEGITVAPSGWLVVAYHLLIQILHQTSKFLRFRDPDEYKCPMFADGAVSFARLQRDP
jgi:hypothetical protein